MAETKSWLCVGLDVSPERFPENTSFAQVQAHAEKIVEATSDLAVAYKPNFAFFERWGAEGMVWLKTLIDFIPDGPLVIADAKRGDIGSTAEQYAESIFSHYGFDAVTLSPYMGRDSIDPFIQSPEKGVFILCRTSNPSAKDFQNIKSNGKPLFIAVAEWAKTLNENDNVGLVVGATAIEELKQIRKITSGLPFLIPGIGAQGGDLKSSLRFGNDKGIGLINVSRSINFAGDLSVDAIRNSAKNYVKQMQEIMI
jgi:orotidine-5'-phosphate decarboxylase